MTQPALLENSLPLFGRKLSAKLESRILGRLDLRSLAECRMVNSQWRDAVDKLNYFWLLFNQRLGIADACELGRERLRAEKMLGDCWITCSFCPVAKNRGTVERDMKLVSADKIDSSQNSWSDLRVRAFNDKSASIHQWLLKLQDPHLWYPDLLCLYHLCIPEDWLVLMYFWEPHPPGGRKTGQSASLKQDRSYIFRSCLFRSYLASGRNDEKFNSSEESLNHVFNRLLEELPYMVAVFPVVKSAADNEASVSPIAFIKPPDKDSVLRCVVHSFANSAQGIVLLLTEASVIVYRLPTDITEYQSQPSILQPDIVIGLKCDKLFAEPSILGLVAEPWLTTDGYVRGAKFLIYRMNESEQMTEPSIDLLTVNYENSKIEYSAGEPITTSSHAFLFSIDSNNCPVFLFAVSDSKQESNTLLQLGRLTLTASGQVELKSAECLYDNPFRNEPCYENPTLIPTILSLTVGRKFYCCLGVLKAEKTMAIAIYRIGCPTVLAQVRLSSIWDLVTEGEVLRQRGVYSLHTTVWIDRGLEPDNPEDAPLMLLFGSRSQLGFLLNWRCHPSSPPDSVLSTPVRLTHGLRGQ